MKDIARLLVVAQRRAQEMRLPYLGALLPQEAHQLLNANPNAKLVDVRSKAELDWVGRIPGSVEIEWMTYPGMHTNPDFVKELQTQVSLDSPVLFICRSGGRSHHAAAAASQAGYPQAYNVLEGFEGDKDACAHRGTLGGWRKARLPWVQG